MTSNLKKQQIVLQKLGLEALELESLGLLERIENLTPDRVLPPRPAIDSLTVSDKQAPVYRPKITIANFAPVDPPTDPLLALTRSALSNADGAGNSPVKALDLGQLDATPLVKTFPDAIGGTDVQDYYHFDLQAKSDFNLTLDGLSANANVFLLDANGNLIVSSENAGNAPESITQTLASGSYYVLVRSSKQDGNPSTAYQLNLKAQFITNAVIVSNPAIDLPDMEFDKVFDRITWQDKQNRLWVAPVDPVTGNFLLDQQRLLDQDLAPLKPDGGNLQTGTGTGNGPEWAYSQDGSEILYTKAFGSTQKDWFVYRASWTGTSWKTGPLPDGELLPQGPNGFAPIGSLDPNDLNPRVFYVLPSLGEKPTTAWRDLNQANGGIISNSGVGLGRWVNGESSSVVYTEEDVDRNIHTFQYDIDTNTKTELPSGKNPFMWRAPEFNNDLVLCEEVRTDNQPTSLGVFRQVNGQWTQINSLRPPTDKTDIRSAEPFIYNGRSYMFFLAENYKGGLSEVWIASIDPDFQFYREVSDPNIDMVWNDPEALSTTTGQYIYFSQRGASIVYKADTGLGPPIPQYNEIVGTASADTLTGTPANDRITGLGGADTLTGAQGKDSFVYQSIGDAGDTIADFTVGQDKIVLTGLFQSLGYTGIDPFVDGYMRVVQRTNGAIVRIDPDGRSGSQTWIALLQTSGVSAIALNSPDNFLF